MLTKKKKCFFLAVNTGYVENETPTSKYIDFHAERSGNGLYCTIAGNVLTPQGHGSNNFCARISDKFEWKLLAKEIELRGAKAGIQISTAWDSYIGQKVFKTKHSNSDLETYKNIAKSFAQNEIIQLFSDLQIASDISVAAGFRHIQLHAAHGYLYNLLLDPFFSPQYELSLELTQKWVEKLKAQKIETSIRLSLVTGVVEIDASQIRLKETIQLPFDYIDLSQGLYNINKQFVYPSIADILENRWKMNKEIAKEYPEKRFIASGRLQNITTASRELADNIDLGICRDLIANPNFLVDLKNGCENRMKCHHHSRGEDSLRCGKWIN